MISLLLTLFISLFSICPSYNQVKDQSENNNIDNVVLPVKKTADYDNHYVSSVTEMLFNVNLFNVAYVNNKEFFRNQGVVDDSHYDFVLYQGDLNQANETCIANDSDIDFEDNYYVSPSNRIRFNGIRYVYKGHTYWGANNSSEVFQYEAFFMDFSAGTESLPYSIQFALCYPNSYSTPYKWQYVVNYSSGTLTALKNYLVIVNKGITPAFYQLLRGALDNETSYEQGYDTGYNAGYDEGHTVGFQNGYTTGYNDGTDVDATASTIFTGILDVALIPVNVFLTIFNFEVFGINIGGIVSGLLTLSVVIIILRFLFGGKKDD